MTKKYPSKKWESKNPSSRPTCSLEDDTAKTGRPCCAFVPVTFSNRATVLSVSDRATASNWAAIADHSTAKATRCDPFCGNCPTAWRRIDSPESVRCRSFLNVDLEVHATTTDRSGRSTLGSASRYRLRPPMDAGSLRSSRARSTDCRWSPTNSRRTGSTASRKSLGSN